MLVELFVLMDVSRDCNTGIPDTGIPGSWFVQYRNTGIETA